MIKRKTEYILTGVFGFIFVLCIIMIIKDIIDYRIAKKEYDSLKEELPLSDITTDCSEDAKVSAYKPQKSEDNKYFDRLYRINPDLVCILSIPSLGIDYPVVQGTDNEKYLNYTFEGKRNPAGCLFMDCENNSNFSDNNTYIYGHNMKDGSMFGSLKQMAKEGFDKSKVKAYITTEEETSRYNLDNVEVVDIENYKVPEDKTKGLLTLYTCWGKNKNKRLLVTFSKEGTKQS